MRCCHSQSARRWYYCVNRSSGKHETGKWIADDDNNCTALRRLGEHVFFLEVQYTSTRRELPSSRCFFQVTSQTLERYGSNVGPPIYYKLSASKLSAPPVRFLFTSLTQG